MRTHAESLGGPFAHAPLETFQNAGPDRDSLLTEAGVNWSVSDDVTLGVAYDGTLGARARDHAVRGSLTVRF